MQKLESYNARVESSIKKLPGQERGYINIKRQQTIKEDLYTYLLKKREEAALSYASTLADSRTVDKAYYAGPISPKVPLTYALALILGFAFPAGLIFIRDILNNRVISSVEIEDATSVPILGELIFQNNLSPIIMNDRRYRILAEQFRMLRTHLEDLTVENGGSRVTQITSGMSGEGKSFITCNLGVALAASGKKTIILEMDMRRPSISKAFNLKEKVGLSEFLEGRRQIEEIIQSVDGHSNLFIIGSGAISSNPSELLEKPLLKNLIDYLRNSFDEILIDTPPVRLVAEGMITSRYSDVNLYVVRHSYTHKSQLKYVEQLNKLGKLKNLHIILNGVMLNGRYSSTQDFDYSYYLSRDQKRLTISSTLKDVIERF
jgi:capsular exopolysaccharide synthesis family protein